MWKKAFAAAFCLAALAVLSVSSSWATPLYSVSTRIISLGTTLNTATGAYEPVIGGVITTRTLGTGGAAVVTHNRGTRYTTVPTTRQIEVEVDPADGYKIASLTRASYEVIDGVVKLEEYQPVTVADEHLHKETFTDSADPLLKGKTQYLVATFVIDSPSPVISRIWQLQVQNNNTGGRITVARGTDSNHYVTVGKPLVKNYIDTTPVRVTVDASVGYFIDYVVINGKKNFQSSGTTNFNHTVDATTGSRLRSFNVGYRKASLAVNTINGSAGGISPLNPKVDPFGTVRLIITPTGSKNKVTAVTTTGGTLTLTDRFGDPVTLPHYGPVKATVTGITTAITVTASYGWNGIFPPPISCTQTCHVDPTVVAYRPEVKAAGDDWLRSKHMSSQPSQVDCIGCHQTMPGPLLTAENNCKSCHARPDAPADLAPLLSAGHDADRSCLNCHNEHSLETRNCADCHNGTLMGRTGYEFAGVTYTDGSHQQIGVANLNNTGTSGPCVACHMSGAEKHLFQASGSNPLCANCHDGGWTAEQLDSAKAQYNAALEELKDALQARGIWFIPNAPFFVADNGCVPGADACSFFDPLEANNSNLSAGEMNPVNRFGTWEDAVPGDNGTDTMGAASNYDLLVHHPGAFAHNRTYAYQLIASSIEFLNGGSSYATGNAAGTSRARQALAKD